ncbi:low-density lipoprotein receptor-related protein 6-like isoform X2 [Amphiura filiformis]|uniref:low-density lipoprotein receptor-related protein 6-like isoform X2 n=1 Tax=Amphiura filiformis TaxID=82378 RepID=UPI003B21EA35
MELTERQLFLLIVAFCGITCCFSQEQQGDIVIVSDFTPPAIYVAALGPRLNFKQVNVDGGRRNISAPAVVDFDPVERRIYWSQWARAENGEGFIARCDLQGRFYQVLIRNLEYALGLALDTVGRKMYFSHEGMALEVANLNGNNRRTLIRELPTSALFVFFDSVGKRVYVSDSTKQTVESIKLDGSNRTIHIDGADGLVHPSGVIVDRKARRIFYSDFGTDRIAATNLRGEKGYTLYQYPLVSTETDPHAMAMTSQNELYWIDRNHPRLQKIPKNVRPGQIVVPKEVGNKEFGWPSGLHIYQGGSEGLKSASLVMYLVVPMIFKFLLNQ